jgi:hypothetical protein
MTTLFCPSEHHQARATIERGDDVTKIIAIAGENPPGMPRPLLEGGQPLPWAEYPVDLREGDHLICVLCGEPLGDPVLFFADVDDWVVAQGGLHRRCARFTRAHCPGVPSRDLLSVPAPLWEELVRTADHPDACSAIRPEREWLERAYERAILLDDPESVLLGDPELLPGDSD